MRVTPDDLNAAVEFDHPFRILPGGELGDAPGVYAPETVVDADADGQVSADAERDMLEQLEREGWAPVDGFSGQQGYRGPVMHASEYLGGDMARQVLEAPGVYVITAVECVEPDPDDPDGWITSETPAGWILLKQVAQ